MELLLLKHDEFDRLYNCSRYDIDSIPLERRSKPIIGGTMLIIYFVSAILHIPCLIAIRRLPIFKEPCYRLMFITGIIDVAVGLVAGFATGVGACMGAVFCTAPRVIYAFGCVGLMLWSFHGDLSVILGVNRVISLYDKTTYNFLFVGKRFFAWLVVPIIHAICMFWFSTTPVFSSIHVSWFYDPFTGYSRDTKIKYANVAHTVHNTFLAVTIPACYVIFAILFLRKKDPFKDLTEIRRANYNFAMYMQVLFISATCTISSTVYVIMNYVSVPDYIVLIGSYFWLLAHSLPPVMYLTINTTVRKGVLRLMKSQKVIDSSGGGTHGKATNTDLPQIY